MRLSKTKAMIKPNDLRVGNFVLEDNEVITVYSDQISNLAAWEATRNKYGELVSERSRPYCPIPITEEMLLKAGFECSPPRAGGQDIFAGYSVWCIGNFVLFGMKHGGKLYFDRNINWGVKYVHQLQNLYHALTGEELQIKL